MLVEIDLLPPLMVQKQSIPIRRDVRRRGDRDVGGVHVGHGAAVGEGFQQAVERRDPDGDEEGGEGDHPTFRPESHRIRGGIGRCGARSGAGDGGG